MLKDELMGPRHSTTWAPISPQFLSSLEFFLSIGDDCAGKPITQHRLLLYYLSVQIAFLRGTREAIIYVELDWDTRRG